MAVWRAKHFCLYNMAYTLFCPYLIAKSCLKPSAFLELLQIDVTNFDKACTSFIKLEDDTTHSCAKSFLEELNTNICESLGKRFYEHVQKTSAKSNYSDVACAAFKMQLPSVYVGARYKIDYPEQVCDFDDDGYVIVFSCYIDIDKFTITYKTW